jgi:hypothetical protein
MKNRFSGKTNLAFILVFSILLFFKNTFAQQNFQLNRQWGLDTEEANSSISTNSYFTTPDDSAEVNYSSFKPSIRTPQQPIKNKNLAYLKRKFSNESFIVVNDTADKFYLTVDPLFNFEGSVNAADSSKKLYKNTRGFLIRGGIGKKFYFESSDYENQATFAPYIDQYIATTGSLNYNTAIVPGQGRAKPFKATGYDFSMASGYVSYSPNKHFNIQAGHGKHFIGDGYRSLILSDNAFNYPYARITSTYKNIQYTNLYTVFTNLTNGGVKNPSGIEPLYQKKIGNYQMLNINFGKRFQLGLVQAMIWQPADSINKQHVNFNTFDPLIGVNTAIYGLHSQNNLLLGATFKLKVTNSISLYGQYILDDVPEKGSAIDKKLGYQIGFKYFNLFTIKKLRLQAEFNSVRPYTYATANSQESYTHYNQALADPLGANFREAIVFLNYNIKKFFMQLQINYALKGADYNKYNFGGNVFNSDNSFPLGQNLNSITTTQGLKTTINYQDFQIGYLVNPATNFNIVFGITNRTAKTDITMQEAEVIYFGIRTSLSNVYYDF